MVRDEDDARSTLEPHFIEMERAVRDAIAEYRSSGEYAKLRSLLSKRSHASVINDLIWSKLAAVFDAVPGFAFPPPRMNRRAMLVHDAFVFRVKKLNRDKRPQNIATQAVMDFLGQIQEQLRFPGFEPATNVDLCYAFTDAAELHAAVYIRCPNGSRGHHWMIQLDEAGGAAVGHTAEVAPIIPPSSIGQRVRVRPAATTIEDEKEAAGEASGS